MRTGDELLATANVCTEGEVSHLILEVLIDIRDSLNMHLENAHLQRRNIHSVLSKLVDEERAKKDCTLDALLFQQCKELIKDGSLHLRSE